jgi:NhaP-type Na+/H+ or K+/H+ antiporter
MARHPGSRCVYYLLSALEHLPAARLHAIVPLVLAAIVGSVLLHGASATLLMNRYMK